ncbi:MAG: helix-turn-helix domain-containing protein [Thermoplasmata archaeon]|uniref:Helix-turn-helix domain-containing protein n=1 Tax=candidate division WOR-3 bacterium TaxID=2052148 RepID=A0A7V5LUP9_UNCW3|nr:MAG: helix-turn-helix domain-containing protein [Thermoplasmata archaeon]RLF45450.1 MAG: transcriptional regulator [Thermoplasmata archaeon]HDH81870.1 helix-turn-helix domain-containing protein [Thermoplasmatales archaeon]HHF53263.1 helix-turn-helix domain-containing protein [candidate division WOR-3 bacterium]
MGGKVPCEIVTWYLLPAIRREMSSIMVNEYEMQQKDAAKLLGVTNAAISQYISGKRGNVDFDGIGKEEFKKSVENIVGGIPAEKEICRLCKFLMESGIIEKLESKT